MSTTFGVKIPSNGEVIPIARRVGIGKGKISVYLINGIAELLPNDTEVIAIDNSNQGIHNMSDIREAIALSTN